MVLRSLFNTEATLILYCYHSVMVMRPLKYGVTIVSKRDYDLKILFILKDIHYRMDYVFKNLLNSEEILYRIGTKVLRTLLFSKGQKKMRRRITRQHKLEEEERKSSRQLNRNSLVCFLN